MVANLLITPEAEGGATLGKRLRQYLTLTGVGAPPRREVQYNSARGTIPPNQRKRTDTPVSRRDVLVPALKH